MKPTQPRVSPFCAKLRTKKYYLLEGPAYDEDELMDASCDAWCGKTQQRVGPDGKRVDTEDCRLGRDCFEKP